MTEPADPHRDLAGVLHDVSNALTVVLGWIGEARAPGADPRAIQDALSVMEQRARVARDLARHAIGGPRVDEQRDLGALVDEVTNALSVEASRHAVRLTISGAEQIARVPGAQDLSQVLTNLILNAFAYAPPGSAVNLAVQVDDERLTLVVCDEGSGVARERAGAIFEGDTTRPGGTGVGLRHSRALARSWGGDVSLLAPIDDRRGACFQVSWPRSDAVPRSPTSTRRIPDLAGVRVLVIEDDPGVTQLLETALEARGAEITIVDSAETFMAAVAERARYDALLVDLSPFEGSSQAALTKIRACAPDAAIVLITGSVDALPVEDPTGSPETIELVRKPFEVREVVAALLRRRRSKLLDERGKPE